jgi:hypothetical protein
MTQTSRPMPSLASNLKYALKANILPALMLQTLALGVALSYFHWSAAQAVFSYIAELRDQFGLSYAIVSTSLFGGLLPFSLMYFSGRIKTQVLLQLIFYCTLWAMMGALIAKFYVFQDYLFGSANDVFTVAKKVAFDQFVFSVFLTSPLLTLLNLWKDSQFSWSKSKVHMNKSLLTLKIPSTIISTWLVWIPAVSVIYTMPSALQIPLFNLVLCLFVLIFALLHVEDELEDEHRL